MSVDQASALEDTLTRLRQRYALHFYLPEGARAGQERQVAVNLSPTALRRYPDAEVRYRRTYVAPESNDSSPSEVTSASPSQDQPNVAAATSPDADQPAPAPKPRRRVSDPNSGSGAGPLVDRTAEASTTTPGSSTAGGAGWPKANGSTSSTRTTSELPAANPQPEKKGGWPRVK
jgi:hypothetical protein